MKIKITQTLNNTTRSTLRKTVVKAKSVKYYNEYDLYRCYDANGNLIAEFDTGDMIFILVPNVNYESADKNDIPL